MASLRARLLAAVLVLSAVGLLLLGAITYAEQRSFLLDRVDQQARSAPPAVAGALGGDDGFGPAGGDRDRDRRGGRRGGGPAPAAARHLRRAARRGRQDASARRSSSTTARASPPTPICPKRHPDRPARSPSTARTATPTTTACSPSATRSRSGTTVVAIPLRDVDQTLHRLLAVEALVIAGVLLLLGAAAWAVVRVGLLPLDRMGHTAGAIAGGDLSHRVESTDPRTEVGRLGLALNAMLDRLERAFTARQASEDRLRQFLADASHELRTPLASIRGYAELFRMGAAREPEDVEKAMRRIEEEAARMGVLVEDLLTLARLDEIADAPHAEVDLGRLVGDAVDDARATAPDREIDRRVDGDDRRHRRRPPAAPGARQPAAQRARPHAGRDADRGQRHARGRRGPPRGARPRPGPADRRPERALRALLARGGRPRARPRRRRASASRSSPGSSTPTTAASTADERARRRRVVRRAPARGISAASALSGALSLLPRRSHRPGPMLVP